MGVSALLGFAWGRIVSEASDTVIQAWQEALETCASEICSANRVEEDDVAARHCDQIPVASKFGGAGRTTMFGRKIWCAAMLGTGITVDLYAGLGDTAALLADGLHRRPSSASDRRLVTFELNLDRLLTVRSRLAQSAVAVHTLDLRSQHHWQREMRQGDWKPVTAFLVPGSTSSYLRPVCQSVEDLGLVLLDPDVEMGYKEFADDWRVLEAQRPRMVAIYNTNLPGGAGWVLNRLLALGEYVEVAQGFNDGGAGEQDVFHQLRAWSLLLHVPGAVLPAWKPGERRSPSTLQQKQHKIVQPARPFDEDTVQMTGLEAKEWIQEQLERGYEWGNTTFRAVRGGEVLRIHRGIGEIVPVEVQRPTDELLAPPTPQTNAHHCFAEADPLVAARQLRTPCFLNCEGPDFDASWNHFRKQVLLQAAGNFPLDPDMVAEATAISHHIVTNDEILIRGRSLFMARLRHEYTHDGHLEGFCLFGLTSAAFLRARQMLDMEPQKFEAHGKTIFAPIVGLNDMDTAYTLVSDSNSKGGVEFSFLENTGWAVSLEDVIINLETQKADLGQPFRQHRFPMPILTSLDKSPKGSIDAPIADFIHWLNQQPALVTTSSCSGRIAIFHGSADASNSKGGEWLLASHETVSDSTRSWQELREALDTRQDAAGAGTLTSLLLEPFVLHAECADAATAQHILGVARDAGFRESGVSLGRKRVMVQIRTVATRLEVPLAMNGTLLVDGNYFQTLVRIANSRLDENAARVARLWRNLREALVAKGEGIEGMEHGQPWIFVCPQECARSVKLALEARGWLDDSRKMQSYGAEAAEAEATPSVAIPLTEEAVEDLQAISEAEAEEVDVSRGGTTVPNDVPLAETEMAEALPETDLGPAGAVPKKKRPPTVAANLNELWRLRRGELRIIQSSVLPRKTKPSGSTSAVPAATEQAKIAEAVQGLFETVGPHANTASFEGLFKDAQSLPALQWRGDVALLPRGSFAGAEWEAFEQKTQAVSGGLWECIRKAVNARLLCRQHEIRVDDVVRGGNVQVLAGTGSGWVVVPGPKGVRYSFDITKCMFSEGNAAEKDRVASWPVEGQTALDMYAGIGFWTLPLLVAGAAKVVACEWNPDALAGLREGLHLLGDLGARCKVLPGDNRRQEVIDETRDTCHRVILGLIPYSRDGFPVAVNALRPAGGTLHVHWNAAVDAEAATAELVAKEVQELLQKIRGPGWQAAVTGIQRIKSFAPRVRASLIGANLSASKAFAEPACRRELNHSDFAQLLFPKAAPVRLCGIGDHLTATFDAVLMVQRSLELVLGDLQIQRDFLGRFCPKHTGQGHQCRQRCELLGSGCGPQEDVSDPVAEWLDGIIHPESLDELPWDLDERRHSLAEASARDSRLQLADLVVCSHPTLLCLFMAEVLPKPMFVHASSTLLYGLHCQNCDRDAWYTNLRHFGTSHLAQRYLQLARNLLLNNQNLVFMAEGRFLAEQVRDQVRVEVPWVPPLGLYTAAGSWQGGQPGSTRRAVVLRSRFFVSLRGELLRSLLREIVSINFPRYPLEVVFLGKDNQFDEQWLSLQQLASFDAAILWPNDLHQRTFHEAYRMAIPLLMPDSASLFRAQRMSNWGYASYGASTVGLDAGGSSSPRHPFPPWWNSFNATPDVIGYWVQFADWEQLPHIQRFATLPGLIVQAATMNLQQISKSMLEHHVQVAKAALDLVSEKLALLGRSDEPRVREKSAREQDKRYYARKICMVEKLVSAGEEWTRLFFATCDMSIAVEVGLLSGKAVTVEVGFDETVATLKCRAQTALGVGRGRLLDPSGSILDMSATIQTAGLENGDSLTMHINQTRVQASAAAFAAILGDGSVVTWGSASDGGDSSAVQDQLKNVQQIQATKQAFAAILGDGSLVTWGHPDHGGDSSAVREQLKNVQQIHAGEHAFAAILGDGSVDQLKNVQLQAAGGQAVAALLGNGSKRARGGRWQWDKLCLSAMSCTKQPVFASRGHFMKQEECLQHLPTEAEALKNFLKAGCGVNFACELQNAPVPQPGSFEGRGIVMSGGPMHVLQALANLEVLRTELKSGMPVEFWHAFELEPIHCQALATRGAKCRQLQVPGVYRQFETVLPSIMASSFREILWLDTDITLLYRPEELFDSPQYQSTGALFWPDHWSFDCRPWGQSSWPGHVALKLLQLKHNASDMQYAQEHETGHFLIDRERHWKPICLANYMASRDFFTRVLHGYKDVFRLAFLKLNASNWLSPVRPGLVGGFLHNGLYFPAALVQFWPAGDLFGTGPHGRHIPLYIHQKKVPGNIWMDILTFDTPMGRCISYQLTPFDVLKEADRTLWQVGETDLQLAERISRAGQVWDAAYNIARDRLLPFLSPESQAKLEVKRSSKVTSTFKTLVESCRCDYDDNMILHILTVWQQAGDPKTLRLLDEGTCQPVLQPFDWETCPIGYTALAVLCSQLLPEKAAAAKDVVSKLLPSVEYCLGSKGKALWPLELEHLKIFAGESGRRQYPGDFSLKPEQVAKFPASIQRCIPLDTNCWSIRNAWPKQLPDGTFVRPSMAMEGYTSCRNCCEPDIGSILRDICFDSKFTEDRRLLMYNRPASGFGCSRQEPRRRLLAQASPIGFGRDQPHDVDLPIFASLERADFRPRYTLDLARHETARRGGQQNDGDCSGSCILHVASWGHELPNIPSARSKICTRLTHVSPSSMKAGLHVSRSALPGAHGISWFFRYRR
ncbi:unnamed protein product [Symbiodinium necroappetens]|uniref:Uncharacterized protein n=1 Tax=Symbiodinium necroappetens TaxID=1628268 RepID=A0A812PS60_9DINO|nr:unnamed protein product [Symbiodinium necroappetens]